MRHAKLRDVFGLSFGELLVLLIVAVVVLGPKDLPRYLRKGGQFAGKMRRLAFEMREKSGIDEVLRTEGIDRDIAEIRKLARGEIGGVVAAARSTIDAARLNPLGSGSAAPAVPSPSAPTPGVALPPVGLPPPLAVALEREYPCEGADSYGALPDTAVVYDGSFPPSALADDALYTRGEEARDDSDKAVETGAGAVTETPA
jgi:sec-independent protein translocase protein TatB